MTRDLASVAEDVADWIGNNMHRIEGDTSWISELKGELRDAIAEEAADASAFEPIPIIVPEDSDQLVDVFRANGQLVFRLQLHVNSKWPSVDILRKTPGQLYLREMHGGDYALDHAAVGNLCAIVLVAER